MEVRWLGIETIPFITYYFKLSNSYLRIAAYEDNRTVGEEEPPFLSDIWVLPKKEPLLWLIFQRRPWEDF